MTTARPVSTMDRIVGKIQRAVGELTGRPDLVIEGEARDTGLPPEDAENGRVREPPTRDPD